MRTLRKAHKHLHRFAWSAANLFANNASEMVALVGTIESASRFDDADESYLTKSYLIDQCNSSKSPNL